MAAAAAPTATHSARSYPKLAVPHSFAGLRSRDSILYRRHSVHLGYKPSVAAAAAVNSSLQSSRIRMHSGENEGDHLGLGHKFNVLPRRHRSLLTTRAYKDDKTEKAEWWSRILASAPYLIALQNSDIGFFLQPLLAHYGMFENLIYFIPGAINGFHPWFLIIHRYFGYKWIVKNKDLPHFIRFHSMMGVLLRTSFQLVWYTSKLFPFMQYDGMFGMHFWAAIVLCFILVLLECVGCALAGKYPDIPYLSDAAYAHTRFDIVSFQSPF
ncbi:hypothetical protein V6N13_101129 [Hibiscus sabdariffa]|uniref:Protein TIC 20 n=1 Tax=Hibiscus sabdariffa TaxID=183260 RepID=A0ABR2QKH1_9ROSI